ncbi:hypothetical protein OQA88_11892 [Cercophora sp. LCS_1]
MAPRVVILLVGPTGSGRSSFVKEVAGLTDKDIKISYDKLHPCTKECKIYSLEHNGTTFELIDTPGFEDIALANNAILSKIARYLRQKSRSGPWVTGALYFHKIPGKRFTGPTRFNFELFKAMCGEQFFSRVACVTTLWSDVNSEKLEQFNGFSKELKAEYFNITKDPKGGVVFDLKDDDPEVYGRILDHFAAFAGSNHRWLRFEKEVVHDGLDAKRTVAGKLIKKKANQGLCTIA